MTETYKTNRKKGNVPVEYKCLLNILPRDIWVRIATKVASNLIHDLFNMQATYKVFLDAGSSDAMYQHATIWQIRLVSFLFYPDRPERRFLNRCVEAENADAILRQGLTEYFWIRCCGIGMELLARASTKGSVELGYLFAMLLLCEHKDEEEVQRGVKMLEFIRTSGKVEWCRNSSWTFSGSDGLTRDCRIWDRPWLVSPPLTLPAAVWLMCMMCLVSRV